MARRLRARLAAAVDARASNIDPDEQVEIALELLNDRLDVALQKAVRPDRGKRP